MSTTFVECETTQNALPVRLCPWLENPYRLVSNWDMFSFDAGKLARAMNFLSENGALLSGNAYIGQLFADFNDGQREFYLDNIRKISEYCDEASYPMTKGPLTRILGLVDNSAFTLETMGDLLGDSARRLREESATHTLLWVPVERARFYDSPLSGWEDIANAFPDTSDDIEEMNKCFALSRYTASVFHSLMVVEGGLITLGRRLGVTDPKEGWDATCKKMEAILKAGHSANRSGLDFAFIEQLNAATQAMKQAWRNKVNHAAGRLSVMKSGFADYIAEDIIHATRAFMRILADER